MLLKLLKAICYLALFILAAALAAMIVLSEAGYCSSLSSASIACRPGFAQTLAELSFGILLISAFTGIPTLFALGGVIFAIRALWIRFGPAPPDGFEDASLAVRAKRYGMIALYILGGFFAIAFIGGTLSTIFSES